MKMFISTFKPITLEILIVPLMFQFGSCISSGEQHKPNIILVMVDDFSAIELNCYGGKGINTPNIDRLAREGIMFGTAYAQPLCGPSRATLLSGKYAHQTLHYGNSVIPAKTFFGSHYTMGQAMKDAGYATAWFGKQHLDNGCLDPSDAGFDHYVVPKYWNGYDGKSQDMGSDTSGMYAVQWYWHPGLKCDGNGIPTDHDDFGPEIELDSLIAFTIRNSDRKLFIYWPTNLPHHQYSAIEGWTRPDVPEYDTTGNRTGKRIPGSLKSNLEFIDYGIGRILETLEENSLADKTLILFLGDNGTAGYGKGKLENEIASHVPFIVYGPGILKRKGFSDILIDFSDVLPTLIELAGFECEYTDNMDGTSFAPYLLGQEFTSRQWISSQLNEARWIRTREWLLDGQGHLWYCGTAFDERTFKDMSFSEDSALLSKRKELQETLDNNIPLPDFEDPEMKDAWTMEFKERLPYEILKPGFHK